MESQPQPFEEKMALERLMTAIHGDDPGAFRELYEAYAPDLRYGVRTFLRKVPRLIPHEGDIMSRAWVRLLARDRKWLRTFDPDKASFTYFMQMVGANTAWQEADRKSHSSYWSEYPADEPPSEADEDVERILIHRSVLDEVSRRLESMLSERDRSILEEVIVFRRPAAEVAEELGMKPGAVWTATNRLRKKLAPLLEDLRAELFGAHRAGPRGAELLVLLAFIGAGMAYDDRREEQPLVHDSCSREDGR